MDEKKAENFADDIYEDEYDDGYGKPQVMKLRDPEKVDRFRSFLHENYDRCRMRQINYGLNKKIIQDWKDCLKRRYVNELEQTKRLANTAFLQENNKQLIETITQEDGKNIVDFADIVDANLTRITFDELLKQTDNIVEQLFELLKSNKYRNYDIVIVVDNHIYSSNTWYTILLTKALFDDYDINKRIINIIDKVSQFQGGRPEPTISMGDGIEKTHKFNLKVKNKFLEYRNTFFIHADDMSYSGTQLLGGIPMGLKYLFRDEIQSNLFHDETKIQYKDIPGMDDMVGFTTNRYFIAIPYIGSQAIMTHFPQMETKVGITLTYPFKNISIFMFPTNMHKIKSLAHEMNDQFGFAKNSLIHKTLAKPYFLKLFRYSTGSLPIFFDHKLADAVSTLTYIISYSSCSTIDERDLIVGHMVTNCEVPPIKEIVTKDNKLKSSGTYDFSNESSRCPKSFYKTLTYTYRGIDVKNKKAGSMDYDQYLGVALTKKPFI